MFSSPEPGGPQGRERNAEGGPGWSRGGPGWSKDGPGWSKVVEGGLWWSLGCPLVVSWCSSLVAVLSGWPRLGGGAGDGDGRYG